MKPLKFLGLTLKPQHSSTGVAAPGDHLWSNMGEPLPWVTVGEAVNGKWFAHAHFSIAAVRVRDADSRASALRQLRAKVLQLAAEFERVKP